MHQRRPGAARAPGRPPCATSCTRCHAKASGMTCVVDDDRVLLGIITDGDLRRKMAVPRSAILERSASEVMTAQPDRGQPPDARRRSAENPRGAGRSPPWSWSTTGAARRGCHSSAPSLAHRAGVADGRTSVCRRAGPAGRSCHRQGMGALQAARRQVDRSPSRTRLAALRARAELSRRQSARHRHRGAEPGRTRRFRRARDPPDSRATSTASAGRSRARSRFIRRCCSGRS